MLRRPGSSGIEGGESAEHSLPSTTISAGPGLELTTTFGLRIRHSNQPLGHDFPYVMICRWVNLQDCFYIGLVNFFLSWCLIRWTAPWTQRRVSVLESMGIPPLKSSAVERKLDLMMAPEQQVDVLCPCKQYRSKGKYVITLIYFCKGKAEFSAAITPVFSVTQPFRNNINLLIWCSRNISCWKVFLLDIFVEIVTFFRFLWIMYHYASPYCHFWSI